MHPGFEGRHGLEQIQGTDQIPVAQADEGVAQHIEAVDEDLVGDPVFRQGAVALADLFRAENDTAPFGEAAADIPIDRVRVDGSFFPGAAVTVEAEYGGVGGVKFARC